MTVDKYKSDELNKENFVELINNLKIHLQLMDLFQKEKGTIDSSKKLTLEEFRSIVQSEAFLNMGIKLPGEVDKVFKK